MRSLVFAFALFMNAFAAAIGEAFVSLSADPLLVWNYGVMAVLSFIGGTCFWLQFSGLDRREDELNMLPTGHLGAAIDAKNMEDRSSEDMGEMENGTAKKEMEGREIYEK